MKLNVNKNFNCESFNDLYYVTGLKSVNILNATDWKEHDFLYMVMVNIRHLMCMLIQLKSQSIDIGAIPYEWENVKKFLLRRKVPERLFPPESWETIGKKLNVSSFKNLFGLIDFFLSLTLSATDAERGFSGMKAIKTSKRATVNNTLLSIHLQMKIDGPPVAEFNPQRSIDHFLTHRSSKSGKMRRKHIKKWDENQKKTKVDADIPRSLILII